MNQQPDLNAKLDRKAVERIIHRAAELQADDRDLGDGLSEKDLLSLGDEVGIPKHLMRRAMLEEQTHGQSKIASGVVPWLFGPTQVSAARVLRREAHQVEAELSHWMTAVELLSVKRRYSDSTSWEAKKDLASAFRRTFGVGGVGYKLAKVNEIAGEVTRLEAGTCHVSLVADIANIRKQRVAGTTTFTAFGGLFSAIGVALGFALPVALIPVVAGVASGIAAGRAKHAVPERVQVALEQILDRLEHSDIELPHGGGPALNPGAIGQIADQIKRNLKALPINKPR